MPTIFLSFGHVDGYIVAEAVRDHLRERGLWVWQDAERIRAGWSWTEEIRDGLRGSDLLVALLSPHSVRTMGGAADQKDSVCLQEIAYAVDACCIPVVPVMVADCEPPFRIFDLQYVDFRSFGESPTSDGDLLKKLEHQVRESLESKGSPRRDWGWQPTAWDFGPFLAEKRRDFTGREWFFDKLDHCLLDDRVRAVLVTGRPGVGKSAIVAELIHRNRDGRILAYHCCQWNTRETLEPGRFVRNLAAMLSARIEDFATMLQARELRDALSEAKTASDPASAFEAGILAPLAKLEQRETRYLVFDALDESLALGPQPTIVDVLATRLDRLPSWLKIVATTRPDPSVLGTLAALKPLVVSADDPENRDDVRRFVDAALESPRLSDRLPHDGCDRDDLRERLLAASEYNFLFVSAALEAIAGGRAEFEDVLALPPGLGSFYGLQFRRAFRVDAADYPDTCTVLCALVAAQRPPSRGELGQVTGLDRGTDLLQVLSRLGSFVHFRADGYSLFHRSLSDWLTALNDDGQAAAGVFHADPVRGHGLWADWCRLQRAGWSRALRAHAIAPRGFAPETSAYYYYRFLPYHLFKAERIEELEDLLLDPGFVRTKREVTSDRHVVADFERLARALGLALPAVAEVVETSTSGTNECKAAVLHALGQCYAAMGRRPQAERALVRADAVATKLDDEVLRAGILTTLGISRFHRGTLESSMRAFDEAIRIFEQFDASLTPGQLGDYAECLDWKAMHSRNVSNYDAALPLHEKAMDIARRAGDRRREAHTIANIGAVYYWKNDYEAALDRWKECLRISRQIEDRIGEVHYCIDVGYMTFLVFHDAKGYEASLGLLDTGIDMARRLQFEEEHARALMNKASLLFVSGANARLSDIEKLYCDALEIVDRNDIARLRWRIHHNLGNVHRRQGALREAAAAYGRAISEVSELERASKPADGQEDFLEHRLQPFESLLLVLLSEGDDAAARELSSAHETLPAYLARRIRAVDLEHEERKGGNRRFFRLDGEDYYVETE